MPSGEFPGTRIAAESDPVLILGGGLIGLAIAHGLARQGRAATVLSRRRSEAAGFVAAGMLAPHAEGLSGALLALGQASLARIPAWVAGIEADSGLGCGLRACGIVVPFASAAERDGYPTAACGEPLDRAGLEREIPGIGPTWRAGLLFPQDGQIDNRRQLMRALERACVNRGVRFEEGCEVLEILSEAEAGAENPVIIRNHPDKEAPGGRTPEPEAAGGWAEGKGAPTTQAREARLVAVRLRRADGQELTVTCCEAVLCGGAWSARLLPRLPVFPVKGQMLSLQGPVGALGRVMFGPGTYLVPREDGLLVVGATSEPEAGFAEGLTPAGQRQLQAGIDALLPAAANWPPMERWWGFRPCTPDQAPLLGEGPIPGLWLATGHHRNGVLLAAISAELVAGALLGQRDHSGLLQAFHWSRFA
jgi:glycine oxidase